MKLRGRARKAMEGWLGRIRAVAGEGIRHGEIKPEADPDKLANLIAGTLEGALMISRLKRVEFLRDGHSNTWKTIWNDCGKASHSRHIDRRER